MRGFTTLVAAWAAATPAAAGELAALQGGSIDLGAFHGIVFYMEAADGYRVVTTIAEGETGLPVRFVATLADGQELMISVPGKLGARSHVLEIARADGKLFVGKREPKPARTALFD